MSVLSALLAIAVVVLIIVVVVAGPAAAQDDAEVLVTSAYERLKHMLPAAWTASSAVGPQRRWLETIVGPTEITSGYIDVEPSRLCINITCISIPYGTLFPFTKRLLTFDATQRTRSYHALGAHAECFDNATIALDVPGVQHFVEFLDGQTLNSPNPIVFKVARLL